jgi:3-hydroxybutyryl-CoA dehydrogenase
VREILARCGKTAVNVKDSPGFIVNRLLLPLINEAARLVDAGVASAAEIDTAMRLGAMHPAGPLQVADLIGLDVCHHILTSLSQALNQPTYLPAAALSERVAAGHLGRKTGRGFYTY